MELEKLIKELDKHIKCSLEEIAAVGKESRELDKKIDALYCKMKDIYNSLEYFHPIIKKQYPKHAEFLERVSTYKMRTEG